jgi:hypothetical protein
VTEDKEKELDDFKDMRGYWKLKDETPNWPLKRLWTCHKTDYGIDE